jgi:hypothetical protein
VTALAAPLVPLDGDDLVSPYFLSEILHELRVPHRNRESANQGGRGQYYGAPKAAKFLYRVDQRDF